ncbi:MAG TPA: response regulator [Lentisphaeria bacterium]|nr:response regulator [Lentisphaeria bacterium]
MIQVFMVEDNPDDIELTLEAFKESNREFNVNVAQDGIEAMKYLRMEGEFTQRPYPDLILLDLNMPRMNGFEVLEEINKDHKLKEIPVAVLSISQSENDKSKVKNLNARAYFVKPTGLDGLFNVIQELVSIVENK